MFKAIFVTAALAAAAGLAQANVTYHFAESTGLGNSTGGLFGNGVNIPRVYNPVTFDFTVSAPLAASSFYFFGYGNIEPSLPNRVLSFVLSDGTPISTFSSADFPATYTAYGSGRSTAAQIGLTTDAQAHISYFDILVQGRSAFDPNQFLSFQLQRDAPATGVAIVMGLTDLRYSTASGSLQCVIYCTGDFAVAAPVPEPASWASLLGGLVLIGLTGRRRQVRNASTLG